MLDSTWSSNAIFWQFIRICITISHHMTDAKTRICQLYLNVWLTLLSSNETCIVWCVRDLILEKFVRAGGLYFLNFQIKLKIHQSTTTPKGQYFGTIFSCITGNFDIWVRFFTLCLVALFTVYHESHLLHMTKTTRRNAKTWKF
jgi:hypothetical protein